MFYDFFEKHISKNIDYTMTKEEDDWFNSVEVIMHDYDVIRNVIKKVLESGNYDFENYSLYVIQFNLIEGYSDQINWNSELIDILVFLGQINHIYFNRNKDNHLIQRTIYDLINNHMIDINEII